MQTYLVKVKVTVIEDSFADVQDFGAELDAFNESNKDVIQAEILEVTDWEKEQGHQALPIDVDELNRAIGDDNPRILRRDK